MVFASLSLRQRELDSTMSYHIKSEVATVVVEEEKRLFVMKKKSKRILRLLSIPTLLAFVTLLASENDMSMIHRFLSDCDRNAIITEEQAINGMAVVTADEEGMIGNVMMRSSEYYDDESPTDIAICRNIIDRFDSNIEMKQLTYMENPAVCMDWEAPHISLLQIIASSVIVGAYGDQYGITYSHECQATLPASNIGRDFDVTTIQQIFPSRANVHVDPNMIENEKEKEKILEGCRGCVAFFDQQGDLFRQRDRITHHCLLYMNPGFVSPERTMDTETGSASGVMVTEGVEENIMTLEPTTLLEGVLRQVVMRLTHAAWDYRTKSNPPSQDGKYGAVIHLDGTSQFVRYHVITNLLPEDTHVVHILLHPNCVESNILDGLNCVDYARSLKEYIKTQTEIAEVGLYIIASTAALYSRMILTKTLICPPSTVGCLLPALTKDGDKIAHILEVDSAELATSATGWFRPFVGLANVMEVWITLEEMTPYPDGFEDGANEISVEVGTTTSTVIVTEGNVEGPLGGPNNNNQGNPFGEPPFGDGLPNGGGSGSGGFIENENVESDEGPGGGGGGTGVGSGGGGGGYGGGGGFGPPVDVETGAAGQDSTIIIEDVATEDNLMTEGVEMDNPMTEGVEMDNLMTEGVEMDNLMTEGVETDNLMTEGVFQDSQPTEGINIAPPNEEEEPPLPEQVITAEQFITEVGPVTSEEVTEEGNDNNVSAENPMPLPTETGTTPATGTVPIIAPMNEDEITTDVETTPVVQQEAITQGELTSGGMAQETQESDATVEVAPTTTGTSPIVLGTNTGSTTQQFSDKTQQTLQLNGKTKQTRYPSVNVGSSGIGLGLNTGGTTQGYNP